MTFDLSAIVTRGLAVGDRPVEGRADDPLDPFAGVHLLLDRDLVRRPLLDGPADADVRALGVLTEDRHVDLVDRLPLERAETLVVELDRAEVDVEVEPEADAQQDVRGVLHVRHPRVAEGADEDRREVVAQVFERAVGQRLAGLEVVIGTPRKVDGLDRQLEGLGGGLEHLHGLGGDVDTDAVTGDHGDPLRPSLAGRRFVHREMLAQGKRPIRPREWPPKPVLTPRRGGGIEDSGAGFDCRRATSPGVSTTARSPDAAGSRDGRVQARRRSGSRGRARPSAAAPRRRRRPPAAAGARRAGGCPGARP